MVGCFSFGIQLLITFISRVVFIRALGIELLGVNDLYTNIISLLCLADMGIETVFMYSLYKPLAESNYSMINSMLKNIRKFYNIIALLILLIGLLIVPFLPLIVGSSEIDNSKLIIYYLFFLFNCVFSYLLVYRSSLLQADQNVHIVKIIKAVSQLFFGIIQIILILVFENYYAYLITMISGTLFSNITINHIAKKKYAFLGKELSVDNNKEYGIKLLKDTKSVFIYKIGTTIINSTDNVFISIILGAAMVGYYSNYHTIILAITSIIGILNSSLIPGIGNFIASVNDYRSRTILFNSLIMIYFILATIFSGSFILCSNQIISMWVGEEYVLNNYAVLSIAISFYFQCIAHPIWIFRETSGLFAAVRKAIISMAFMNIVFSLIGGYLWGIAGIIGATTLSRLLSLFWYEPKLLNQKIFNNAHNGYWMKWISYFTVSSMIIIPLTIIFRNKLDSLEGTIVKVIIVTIITFVAFYVFNRKSDEFIFIKNKFKNILMRGKGTKSTGEEYE